MPPSANRPRCSSATTTTIPTQTQPTNPTEGPAEMPEAENPAREVVEQASTTGGLPVSPSLGPTLAASDFPVEAPLVDRRVVLICCVSIAVACVAAVIARILIHLIALVTHIAFFGKFSANL